MGGFFTESMEKKRANCLLEPSCQRQGELCEATECCKSISVAMMDSLGFGKK